MTWASFLYVSDVQQLKPRELFKNRNRNQPHKSAKTLFFFLAKIDIYNLERLSGHNLLKHNLVILTNIKNIHSLWTSNVTARNLSRVCPWTISTKHVYKDGHWRIICHGFKNTSKCPSVQGHIHIMAYYGLVKRMRWICACQYGKISKIHHKEQRPAIEQCVDTVWSLMC